MDTSRFAVPLESENETLGKGAKAPAENGPVGAASQAEVKEAKEGVAGDAGACPAPAEPEAGESWMKVSPGGLVQEALALVGEGKEPPLEA